MRIILFLFLLQTVSLFGQEDTLFDKPLPPRENRFGGLCAYYFWENEEGVIKKGSFKQGFKLNHDVLLFEENKESITDTTLMKCIRLFANTNTRSDKQQTFELETNGKFQKVHLPLQKNESEHPSSFIYIKDKGVWTAIQEQNVLYFDVNADNTLQYSHSNDSLDLQLDSIHRRSFGHLLVYRVWNYQGEIVSEQVLTFNGRLLDVETIKEEVIRPSQHYIIFANGYRGRKKNKDVTDNLVTRKDRYTYWLRLDRAFVRRIKPDDYFYIDGNHSISTSNHRTMVNFSYSYSRIKSVRKKDKNAHDYHLLNLTPNDSGFYLRKESGRIAGKSFLSMMYELDVCGFSKDTIDIVCHSMGYSYSLGFIEEIKDHVVFRNMYIIAPENARAGGTDWSLFQEVWQYGTHTEEPDPEPIWKQDGIAPQTPVPGIENLAHGGRVYFPKDAHFMNFVNSHMLNHYRWMFKEIKQGEKGYVH